MKVFNVGAARPAIDSARLSDTNDLVQRTLTQHGLVSSTEQGGGVIFPDMPSLGDMLARYPGPNAQSEPHEVIVPDGASFTVDTFTCTAGSRRFWTYIPVSAVNDAHAVVMMLHGCTQTPEDFCIGTGMNDLAEAHGFIVVYPAQSRGDNAQTCWNWFSRDDQRRGRGEPAILAGIAQQVCAEYGVARCKTFVAGLSAGAAMAVILGEAYADVFAAVGAHSGLPVGSANNVSTAYAAMAGNAIEAPLPTNSNEPVRTILFHGSADSTVHPSNAEYIARRARLTHSPQIVETTISGNANGRAYTRSIASEADGTTVVDHWTVDGQEHVWSGGQLHGAYTDPKGPDASAEMISFFFEPSSRTD